jgi:hypothetical protein
MKMDWAVKPYSYRICYGTGVLQHVRFIYCDEVKNSRGIASSMRTTVLGSYYAHYIPILLHLPYQETPFPITDLAHT